MHSLRVHLWRETDGVEYGVAHETHLQLDRLSNKRRKSVATAPVHGCIRCVGPERDRILQTQRSRRFVRIIGDHADLQRAAAVVNRRAAAQRGEEESNTLLESYSYMYTRTVPPVTMPQYRADTLLTTVPYR